MRVEWGGVGYCYKDIVMGDFDPNVCGGNYTTVLSRVCPTS